MNDAVNVISISTVSIIFFFQAEDGIRDLTVTGVQTCALPIMLDTVRWMLDLRWPRRISSTGGIYVQKDGKSNISDTQFATFEYDGLNIVWTHRSWGNPPDPKYPWAMTLYGDKGMLKASGMSY